MLSLTWRISKSASLCKEELTIQEILMLDSFFVDLDLRELGDRLSTLFQNRLFFHYDSAIKLNHRAFPF